MNVGEAFTVLGVPSTADLKQIKTAYRKRAVETHPDKGGNSLEFIKVRAAYEILCSFLQSPDIDDDFPIPEDLRGVIDEIVREFRAQFQKSEALCSRAFREFNSEMNSHILSADRDRLKRFGEDFRREWNELVLNLFEHFNNNCRATILKYEGWFQKSLEPTFEELYNRQLRAFATSPRFYLYGGILLGLGSLLAWMIYGSGVSDSIPFLISVDVLPLGLLPFVYRFDCSKRRKCPADVQTLNVQLFKIDLGVEFQGTACLKQSSANTIAAGWAGFAIGDFIGGGHTILGAIAGAVIGEVIGRIKNPTEKMRQMISDEFNRLVSVAEPEVTKYVTDCHQKLMQDIQKDILANYKQGMKRTVLLLSSDKSPASPRKSSRQPASVEPINKVAMPPGNKEILIQACKSGGIVIGAMVLCGFVVYWLWKILRGG